MLSEIRFRMFKSFVETGLPVEPLTILIGANASGKSNAIDGVQILSGLATNREISDILDGMRGQENGIRGMGTGIRGGSRGAARYNNVFFQLGCTVDLGDYHLDYEIKIRVRPHVWLESESLFQRIPGLNEKPQLVYKTEAPEENSPNVFVVYRNRQRSRHPQVSCLRNYSILSQIPGRFPADTPAQIEIRDKSEKLSATLRNILIFNPMPQLMRDYVHSSRVKILPNGENLSAVVADIIRHAKTKEVLLGCLADYPEQQVVDITVIDTPTGDVMLSFTEKIGKESRPIDVRGLSDGTLRFLAIIAAVVAEDPGTTVVVEEVDNGLHPSRAKKLVSALRDLGQRRKIDVIVTTHNPAVLNALRAEDLPGVVVCYRDHMDGTSRFMSWIDLPHYPELMARGGIGDIVTAGPVAPEPDFNRREHMLQWAQRRLEK